MKTKKQTRKSLPGFGAPKKWWLVAVAVVLIVVAAVTSHQILHNRQVAKEPQITGKINYGPPTKQEQEAANQQKQTDVDAQHTPPPATANVIVSDASQYGDTVEVRAYVSNAAETGGTCTVTFSQGTSSFSVSSQAAMAASSTQCGAIDVPVSRFPTKGTWNVAVQYTSSALAGQAQATTITVQ
jgi:hypothetical protein